MKSERRVRSTREHYSNQPMVRARLREELAEGGSAEADLLVWDGSEFQVSENLEPIEVFSVATGVTGSEGDDVYIAYFTDTQHYEQLFEVC